jgi:hypothetical protein
MGLAKRYAVALAEMDTLKKLAVSQVAALVKRDGLEAIAKKLKIGEILLRDLIQGSRALKTEMPGLTYKMFKLIEKDLEED